MDLPVRDMKQNSKPELFKSIKQMQFKQRQENCEMWSKLHSSRSNFSSRATV